MSERWEVEAGKDVAGFRSIVVVSWYCFFSFFLSFCRLRSLNVAVKLLLLLLDVDAAAVVVVNLVAFYTDVVDFCYTCCLEMFSLFFCCCCLGVLEIYSISAKFAGISSMVVL